MSCTMNWEEKGLYARFSGKASIVDVLAMMESAGADPRFDGMRYIVADYLDVTEQDVTAEQVEEVAALGFAQAFSNPNVVHAAVADDEQICALLRHWKAVAENSEQLAFFTTLEQARAWIAQQALTTDFARRLR